MKKNIKNSTQSFWFTALNKIPYTDLGKIDSGQGKTHVGVIYLKTPRGIIAHLYGGTPHIGSISMSYGDKLFSVKVPKHKDHVIADDFCRILKQSFKYPIVVTAGIHYNKLSKIQLASLMQNSKKIAHKMALEFKA